MEGDKSIRRIELAGGARAARRVIASIDQALVDTRPQPVTVNVSPHRTDSVQSLSSAACESLMRR